MTHNWIINWFLNNTEISNEDLLNKLDENYFELGWIDSLKFIIFITDIEKHFKIKFSNSEFQNRHFSTINGLVKIIEGYTDV